MFDTCDKCHGSLKGEVRSFSMYGVFPVTLCLDHDKEWAVYNLNSEWTEHVIIDVELRVAISANNEKKAISKTHQILESNHTLQDLAVAWLDS